VASSSLRFVLKSAARQAARQSGKACGPAWGKALRRRAYRLRLGLGLRLRLRLRELRATDYEFASRCGGGLASVDGRTRSAPGGRGPQRAGRVRGRGSCPRAASSCAPPPAVSAGAVGPNRTCPLTRRACQQLPRTGAGGRHRRDRGRGLRFTRGGGEGAQGRRDGAPDSRGLALRGPGADKSDRTTYGTGPLHFFGS
jgi:hypothetical protein